MFEIVEKKLNVQGLDVAYTVCGPEGGRMVFCVHGLLSNGRDYDFLAQELAEKGYRCVAIDLPGRGKSQRFLLPKLYNPQAYLPYCIAVAQAERAG